MEEGVELILGEPAGTATEPEDDAAAFRYPERTVYGRVERANRAPAPARRPTRAAERRAPAAQRRRAAPPAGSSACLRELLSQRTLDSEPFASPRREVEVDL